MKTKLYKSKKGVVEDASFWIFRIIQIMIVVFAVVFFVNSIIKENIDTGELELELITARVINSPSCLAYFETINDDTRVYPGIINLDNYNEKLKQNCIVEEEVPYLGLKIHLEGLEPIFFNKDEYDFIEPLTFSSKYQKVHKIFPVQVKTDTGLETKRMEIIAVAKKR